MYCQRCPAEGHGARVLWPGRLSEWGKGRGAVSTVRLQVEAGNGTVHGTSHSGRGQGYCVCSTSQWEGWGTVSTVLLTVGGVEILCPQYLSQWEGWGRVGGWSTVSTVPHSGKGGLTMSTVPLTVGGVGESGRGGVLCPQYLSLREGTGVPWSQIQAPGPRRCRIWQGSVLPGPPHSLPLRCEPSCSPCLHPVAPFAKGVPAPPALSPRLF